jgi:hypothetical protein
LIRDLVADLQVSTIDYLVSHSAAIHLSSRLWSENYLSLSLMNGEKQADNQLNIKSIALLSPHSMFHWNQTSFLVPLISPIIAQLIRHKAGVKIIDFIQLHKLTNLIDYPIRF